MTMNEYDSPGLVQHLGGKATAPHREGYLPLSSLAGFRVPRSPCGDEFGRILSSQSTFRYAI